MPAGRPTDYDPKYCDEIVEYLAQGYSYAAFAAKIGVCRDTINEWARVHEEFSAAKKRANDLRIAWWEQHARAKMMGESKASDTVLIFMLKNAAPDLYGDRQQVEVKSEGNSVLNAVSTETLSAIARDLAAKQSNNQ